MAKRQRQRACQRRDARAPPFGPAARSRRNTASLTVLTSTRPHDGSAGRAGLRPARPAPLGHRR